jgi:hypothetical protein
VRVALPSYSGQSAPALLAAMPPVTEPAGVALAISGGVLLGAAVLATGVVAAVLPEPGPAELAVPEQAAVPRAAAAASTAAQAGAFVVR